MTQLTVEVLQGDQLSVEVLESGITQVVEVTHPGPRGATGAAGADGTNGVTIGLAAGLAIALG